MKLYVVVRIEMFEVISLMGCASSFSMDLTNRAFFFSYFFHKSFLFILLYYYDMKITVCLLAHEKDRIGE